MTQVPDDEDHNVHVLDLALASDEPAYDEEISSSEAEAGLLRVQLEDESEDDERFLSGFIPYPPAMEPIDRVESTIRPTIQVTSPVDDAAFQGNLNMVLKSTDQHASSPWTGCLRMFLKHQVIPLPLKQRDYRADSRNRMAWTSQETQALMLAVLRWGMSPNIWQMAKQDSVLGEALRVRCKESCSDKWKWIRNQIFTIFEEPIALEWLPPKHWIPRVPVHWRKENEAKEAEEAKEKEPAKAAEEEEEEGEKEKEKEKQVGEDQKLEQAGHVDHHHQQLHHNSGDDDAVLGPDLVENLHCYQQSPTSSPSQFADSAPQIQSHSHFYSHSLSQSQAQSRGYSHSKSHSHSQSYSPSHLLNPRVCAYCGKAFSSASKMRRHVAESCPLADQPKTSYKCSWCEILFVRRTQCLKHIQQIKDCSNAIPLMVKQ